VTDVTTDERPEKVVDITEQIRDTVAAIDTASDKYDETMEMVGDMQARMRKLRGFQNPEAFDANRVMSMVTKFLPKAAKWGTVIGGSSGVTALLAEQGAFTGILSRLGGIFGGG